MNHNKLAFALTCSLLLALLLVFFHAAVFEGKIQAQFDHLFAFYPWKSIAPESFHDQNPLLSDQALTLIPFYKKCAAQLRDGIIPLWNPSSLGGTPLIGNYSSSLFYPFYWPYFLFDSDFLLVWVAIGMLLFCGVGTALYLRAIQLSWPAALFGAVVFTFSGFNILWLFHQHVKIAVFLPWLLYLSESYLRTRKRGFLLFLALAVGVQFMGGHMETSFHVLFAASVYFLVRALQVRELRGRRIAAIGGYVFAVGLGTLLAACQLLPFLEYLLHSSIYEQRSAASVGFSDLFSFSGFSAAYLKFFALLVDPNLFGSPLRGNFNGPLNYNELNGAYVGLLPLALAAGSLFLRRKSGAHKTMILLLAVVLALVIQLPVIYPLFKMLPGFSMSNTPRIMLVAGFALAAMAAISLDRMLGRIGRPALRGLAFSVVLAAGAFNLYLFGSSYNPVVDKAMAYPETETTKFLNSDPDLFRISTPLSTFPHETHLPYGIASARGYDALEIRTYTEFMSLLSDHEYARYFVFATPYYDKRASKLFDLANVKYFVLPPDSNVADEGLTLVYSGETKIFQNDSWLPRAFLVSDAKVVKDKEERLALLGDDSFDPARQVVLEEEVSFEKKPLEESRAEIEEYRADRVRIRVKASSGAFLVLSDNYFPGWKAFVDGRPARILRADHTFRAVQVPAGESRVEFRYRPGSFYAGISLSAAAAGVILLLSLARAFKKGA